MHIDFGRVFESQGNFDAAVLEYQDALTVVETRRRGPFRPADQALAHRRMGAPSIGWDDSPRPRCITKGPQAQPERPEGLERRGLQLLSPGPVG